MVGGGHPSYLSVSFNRLVGCIPCYVQYAIGIFDNCGSGVDFSVRWHNLGVVGPVDSSVFKFREHWGVAIRRAAVSTWKVGGVGAFQDYVYAIRFEPVTQNVGLFLPVVGVWDRVVISVFVAW